MILTNTVIFILKDFANTSYVYIHKFQALKVQTVFNIKCEAYLSDIHIQLMITYFKAVKSTT